jgi:hypothetical protein
MDSVNFVSSSGVRVAMNSMMENSSLRISVLSGCFSGSGKCGSGMYWYNASGVQLRAAHRRRMFLGERVLNFSFAMIFAVDFVKPAEMRNAVGFVIPRSLNILFMLNFSIVVYFSFWVKIFIWKICFKL